MDDELKAYLIVGAIVSAILTLVFHFPLGLSWGISIIFALLATFAGVFIVIELD